MEKTSRLPRHEYTIKRTDENKIGAWENQTPTMVLFADRNSRSLTLFTDTMLYGLAAPPLARTTTAIKIIVIFDFIFVVILTLGFLL